MNHLAMGFLKFKFLFWQKRKNHAISQKVMHLKFNWFSHTAFCDLLTILLGIDSENFAKIVPLQQKFPYPKWEFKGNYFVLNQINNYRIEIKEKFKE